MASKKGGKSFTRVIYIHTPRQPSAQPILLTHFPTHDLHAHVLKLGRATLLQISDPRVGELHCTLFNRDVHISETTRHRSHKQPRQQSLCWRSNPQPPEAWRGPNSKDPPPKAAGFKWWIGETTAHPRSQRDITNTE